MLTAAEDALARSIGDEAAAGCSLLDSDVLAAAELAHQLGLTLDEARTRHALIVGHAQLEELSGALEFAREELRTRAAAVAGDDAAAVAADGADHLARLAALCAGVPLHQPTKLASAYGLIRCRRTCCRSIRTRWIGSATRWVSSK